MTRIRFYIDDHVGIVYAADVVPRVGEMVSFMAAGKRVSYRVGSVCHVLVEGHGVGQELEEVQVRR